MRKLSDAILRGMEFAGPSAPHTHRGYFGRTPKGQVVFDPLALAAIGSLPAREIGVFLRLVDTSAPDFVATRINEILHSEFPCLFHRVKKYRTLVTAYYLNKDASIFRLITSLHERGLREGQIADILRGAGL